MGTRIFTEDKFCGSAHVSLGEKSTGAIKCKET